MRFIATDCDSAGAQIVTVLMSHMAGITGIAGIHFLLAPPTSPGRMSWCLSLDFTRASTFLSRPSVAHRFRRGRFRLWWGRIENVVNRIVNHTAILQWAQHSD